MSDADARRSKLDEVFRLATALAEQMVTSQAVGRSIPAEQLTALVTAARCLTDNDIPGPPLVQEIVHEISERVGAAQPTPEAEARRDSKRSAPNLLEEALNAKRL